MLVTLLLCCVARAAEHCCPALQEDKVIRISLGAFAAQAIVAMVGALALLAQPGVVEAQSHSASRDLPADLGGAPGSELRVTITADSYGVFGQVVETLPEGFALVSASLEEDQVMAEGQDGALQPAGGDQFHLRRLRPRHGRAVHLHRGHQERRPRGTDHHRPPGSAGWAAADPHANCNAYADVHSHAGAYGHANP